jgi:tRNA G37 N-methylase Trm5
MKRGILAAAICCLGVAVLFSQEKSESSKKADQAKRSPDVIFVPTPQDAVEKMLELAEVKKGDVVYDLGCGDGRIVVTAAKKHGARGIGIDIDPQRIAESKENVRTNGVEKLVTIKNADIFEETFSDATVITLYLLPSLNVKLIPQFDKLKPGTRIVSYQFNMDGVKPKETYTGNGRYTIYKWVTPLDKEARSQ